MLDGAKDAHDTSPASGGEHNARNDSARARRSRNRRFRACRQVNEPESLTV
jgi:hypothetical protein